MFAVYLRQSMANLSLPYFGAGDVGAYDDGAPSLALALMM